MFIAHEVPLGAVAAGNLLAIRFAALAPRLSRRGAAAQWRSRLVDRRLAALSARELEVLRCMTDGLGNSSIAGRMFLSLNTVRTHARNIQRKLTFRSNVAAVAVALEDGLTSES